MRKLLILSSLLALTFNALSQDHENGPDKVAEFYFTINGGQRVYPENTNITLYQYSDESVEHYLSIIGTKDSGLPIEQSISINVNDGMTLNPGSTQFFIDVNDPDQEYGDNIMEFVDLNDFYNNFECVRSGHLGLVKFTSINTATRRVSGFFRGEICSEKKKIKVDCRFTNWPYLYFVE